MSATFRRRRDGDLVAQFHPVERDILQSLLRQLVELVADGLPQAHGDPLAAALEPGPTSAPDDPVLQRLFPDAYRDDDHEAAEFRRYTEFSLRQAKIDRAMRVLATLEDPDGAPAPAGRGADQTTDRDLRIRLAPSLADDWLGALTDLRLALGVRLGLDGPCGEADDAARDAADVDADADPAEAYVRDIHDWLGWVQESLLTLLLG